MFDNMAGQTLNANVDCKNSAIPLIGPTTDRGYPVEAFRAGYPRFTALLSTDPAFQNFRRFTRTRTRLILLKQDEIAVLEETLDRVDNDEVHELYLGCSRRDRNPQRYQILQDLGRLLIEYGQFIKPSALLLFKYNCSTRGRILQANEPPDDMLERSYTSLSHLPSSQRDVQSLLNWSRGTSSIARQETTFLSQGFDLASLTSRSDSAISRIESIVEDCTFWIETRLRKVSPTSSCHVACIRFAYQLQPSRPQHSSQNVNE
jgi:hypothetical protein